ncbi:MAG: 2,3-bisphosphoglycerate-dependent phosphoglycerate mutase [Candidatus Woesearchaeota archaeon]
MGYLVLVRHGESRWNLSNKFTGMVDVPLSSGGVYEALLAAQKLEGLNFDIAFTSELVRAQETLLIILSKQNACGIFQHKEGKGKAWAHYTKKLDDHEIPIIADFALNERYYGDLQGLNKKAAQKKFGSEKVFLWRRSFDVPPPHGECLKDVCERTIPYFEKEILPHIKKGKNVIIAAHGNSLRSIIKHIETISDADIPSLELPTGVPIVYKYSKRKLVKENHVHSFNRPVYWDEPKSNSRHNV